MRFWNLKKQTHFRPTCIAQLAKSDFKEWSDEKQWRYIHISLEDRVEGALWILIWHWRLVYSFQVIPCNEHFGSICSHWRRRLVNKSESFFFQIQRRFSTSPHLSCSYGISGSPKYGVHQGHRLEKEWTYHPYENTICWFVFSHVLLNKSALKVFACFVWNNGGIQLSTYSLKFACFFFKVTFLKNLTTTLSWFFYVVFA